jgi:hypothetical protein
MRGKLHAGGPDGDECAVIDADRAIAAIAGRQRGVVTRTQLLAAGIGGRAIERRLRAGRYQLLPYRAQSGPVDITVVGRQVARRPGIRIHRVRSLDRRDVRNHRPHPDHHSRPHRPRPRWRGFGRVAGKLAE